MSKKKLLLLGGSTQQVIAIEKAKAMGYYTVLCDYLPDNPGQYVADKFYQVSSTDIDAVYEVAKAEKVDGILPYSSDPAAYPASVVCERLGLPTNPAKSVEILGLKYRFREFLSENGFACPKFFKFTKDTPIESINDSVSSFTYPIVIKPTDCSGSKGITIIDNPSALPAAVEAAKKFSRNGVFVCEEYIQRGFPYIIESEAFIEDGKISIIAHTISLRSDNNTGLLPLGYLWSYDLSQELQQKIVTELQKIIGILGIKFGEINVELIINRAGEVQFIEIGPRAGGNMIPVVLSDAFECDLISSAIRAAVGLPAELNAKEINGKYCIYVMHSKESGIFDHVEIDDTIKPYVYRKKYYRKEGSQIEAYTNAWNAVGMLFLHFPDSDTANKYFKDLESLVKVIVR